MMRAVTFFMFVCNSCLTVFQDDCSFNPPICFYCLLNSTGPAPGPATIQIPTVSPAPTSTSAPTPQSRLAQATVSVPNSNKKCQNPTCFNCNRLKTYKWCRCQISGQVYCNGCYKKLDKSTGFCYRIPFDSYDPATGREKQLRKKRRSSTTNHLELHRSFAEDL